MLWYCVWTCGQNIFRTKHVELRGVWTLYTILIYYYRFAPVCAACTSKRDRRKRMYVLENYRKDYIKSCALLSSHSYLFYSHNYK